MKPRTHVLSSVVLALVIYYFLESTATSLAVIISGVFIDLDHIYDFWISRPPKFLNINHFLTTEKYMRQINQKAYVFLHAYELLLLLWLATVYSKWHPVLLGISAGFSLHLVLDDIGNHLKTLSYFLIFRAYKKFDVFRDKG